MSSAEVINATLDGMRRDRERSTQVQPDQALIAKIRALLMRESWTCGFCGGAVQRASEDNKSVLICKSCGKEEVLEQINPPLFPET